MLKFSIDGRLKGKLGRAGTIETTHGIIQTPAFIPVGTKATVKSVTTDQVKNDVHAQAILANTYHLYLQPGPEIIRKAGGLGKFMNWSGPTFTDSGGFQAFSLQGGKKLNAVESNDSEVALAKVTDDGVSFKSVIDGSSHKFTPESCMKIQRAIGADIIFTLDECAKTEANYDDQKAAITRTHEWAKRCLNAHKKSKSQQALYGIVQGARFEDLRKASAKTIGAMDFDGYGIGGTFDKADMSSAVGWVCRELPENKPRHLLGIGEPMDIILGIENGADTFDCVLPTRLARNGGAYTSEGRLNLTNAKYVADMTPLDHSCECHTCKNYTRAYLSHLFRAKEMLAATLTTIHNLHFYVTLTKNARQAILNNKWSEFKIVYSRYSN